MNKLPIIALSAGEPAGIGPDICIDLAQSAPKDCAVVIIADPALMQQRAQQLGLPLVTHPWTGSATQGAGIYLAAVTAEHNTSPGRLDRANAGYVLATLDRAIDGCLSQEFHALLTAPVHKGIINDAGITFSGHTEYLAQRCQVDTVVMMLIADSLRVALATTHLPLSEVSKHISQDRLRAIIQTLHRDLRQRFGLAQPEILVCGLNPHAGEGGHLGREEIEIIAPLLEELRAQGMHLRGPLAADTMFTPKILSQADAVLAMYHDQGLPVLKYVGFGKAVNITLGLPFIRTSVDHGTALELAGTGQADSGSLRAALALAQHCLAMT